MLLFILFIAAVCGLFHYLLMKSVSEYSYYGDIDAHRGVDYWYYQTRIDEKQNA